MALDLYSADQLASPYFDQYMEVCARSPTNDTSFSDIWKLLGRGPYRGSNTKAGDLLDLQQRVLHRLIIFSVHQRKSSQEKIGEADPWLLN